MFKTDGTWQNYDSINSGLACNTVHAIAIDSDNSKWFSTCGGASVLRVDGSWYTYDPPGIGLPGADAIAIDHSGDYWFGTSGSGASVLYTGQDYVVADNAQWLDKDHFRSTYDVTSLVPRDIYAINVSGVKDTNGMEIPTDTRFGFTVDYAGEITDQTPPSVPWIIAGGVGSDSSKVEAIWSANDLESSITGYRYAIGSAPGATDIVNWTGTSSTSMVRSSLGFVAGQQYWVAVQARNAGGLWSTSGYSGFIAGVPYSRVYLPLVLRNQ